MGSMLRNIAAINSILLGSNIILLSINIFSWYSKRKKNKCIKKNNVNDKSVTNGQVKDEGDDISLKINPIGHIISIYRLCIGTPRQGLLSPHSRGKIILDTNLISSKSLIEIDKFSHVWLLFQFHANTNTTAMSTSTKNGQYQFPSLIKPPALKGKKCGLFATRTPHRPNPIGLTLCKIDKVDIAKGILYVSGIDLISNTPILDIKPHVPFYDSVRDKNKVKLPPWVSDGLSSRRNVTFTSKAIKELELCIPYMELYNKNEISIVKSCIMDILSVDIRSVYQTKKQSMNEFKAHEILNMNTSNPPAFTNDENNDKLLCTQQIDKLLVHFHVEENSIEVRHVEIIQLN